MEDLDDEVVVNTKLGQLRGKLNETFDGKYYYSFQGIPYAKAPIGKLRFKAPQPADPWNGIRNATVEANKCFSKCLREIKPTGSEDCLFLNIYIPEVPSIDKPLKPVMVYIHGGSFVSGSGNLDFLGPDFLVMHDVVLVTFNYRLGMLGFLCFDDPSIGVPGNAGLKDQVMALKWIKDNIVNFSGNPECVTIFGEGCGGISAHALMLSPMANGLFHRVIMQSGTILNEYSMGQRSSSIIAEALHFPPTSTEREIFNQIKIKNKEELLKLQNKIPNNIFLGERRTWGPVIEKSSAEMPFLAKDPRDIIASGDYSQVPIIVGYCNREGLGLQMFLSPSEKMNLSGYFNAKPPSRLNVKNDSKEGLEIAQKIKKFYYDKEDISNSTNQLLTDFNYLLGTYDTVRRHKAVSKEPVYVYRFSVETKFNLYKEYYKIKNFGACHGDDLGYLFKNIFTPDVHVNSLAGQTVYRLTKFWTSFARTGNPNPGNSDALINVEWKPTEEEEVAYLEIGENLTLGVNPDFRRIQFWDDLEN